MHSWTLIYDVVLLLTASLVLGALFVRLRQSAILGYLLAGTMLGPNGFNLIKSEASVQAIAELGVTLLLFSLGLEFSWARLRTLGRGLLVAGGAQVAATTALAAAVALACGMSGAGALVAGAMIALSSTACALRVLMDRAEIETVHGRYCLAILLVQDMAVVPLALVISVLGREGSSGDLALHVGRILLMTVGLIAALYLLLNKFAVWSLGTMTMTRNRELTILLAVVTGLGSAWAAHEAGLSPALGAFVAGMFLGGSPFAPQVRADVSAMRIVLLTLFFGSAGMLGDPVWMITHAPLLLTVTAAMLIGKAAIIWGVLRFVNCSHAVGVATGLCISQMSEFAFVLAGVATQAQPPLLSRDEFMLLASSAILSLLLTPYLIALAPRIGHHLERRFHRGATVGDGGTETAAATHPPHDVVIVGFGPAGQRVAQSLMGLDHAVLVLDQNADSARAAREMGCDFLPGDATQEEVLEHARIAAAKVVVIALPVPAVVGEVLRQVRHLAPQASVIVRCRYHLFAPALEQAGAHAVIDEEQEVGRRLAAQVRRFVPPAEAEARGETSDPVST